MNASWHLVPLFWMNFELHLLPLLVQVLALLLELYLELELPLVSPPYPKALQTSAGIAGCDSHLYHCPSLHISHTLEWAQTSASAPWQQRLLLSWLLGQVVTLKVLDLLLLLL